jgi:hypothetical protein
LRLHSRFVRRPSASIVVASVALFVSLGGVGYAATQLPFNSVGTNQLQHASVTGGKVAQLAVGFRKIQLGAVGIKRINTGQVQARVTGTCATGSAMDSIGSMGNTQCTPTSPNEVGATTTAPVSVPAGTATTMVQSLALPAGSSYMVFANPQVNASGGTAGSQAEVDCTLSIAPGDASTTQTRSVTFQVGAHTQIGPIPLMIPAPAVANGSSASVSCVQSVTPATAGTPTVSVATSINAIQTATNS